MSTAMQGLGSLLPRRREETSRPRTWCALRRRFERRSILDRRRIGPSAPATQP